MARLTVEQEQALIARIRAGDKAARNEIAVAYYDLARSVAHRFNNSGLAYEDREAAALLGLAEAIDHIVTPGDKGSEYNEAEGRFTTYAVQWLVARVRRAVAENDGVCEIPVSEIGLSHGEISNYLFDTYGPVDHRSPAKSALFNESATLLANAIKERLTKREADVLERRYGLNGYRGQTSTLDEIGNALGGLTRERVRQIETSALRKLQGVAGLAIA